jgi:RNA methyltransferase, TrmH family
MDGVSQGRRRQLARLGARKSREREGLVLVEGPRAVRTALEAGVPFRYAVTTPEGPEAERRALAEAGVELLEVTASQFLELAHTDTPQGILAVVDEPRPGLDALAPAARPGGSPLLVLDRVQDPGNVGTLVRAAAALGAPGVVALDGTVDPWNPKVVRASAGEAFRIPLVRADWDAFEAWRRASGCRLWVADAGGADARRFAASLSAEGASTPSFPAALLVGNEGSGPRSEALTAADAVLALPLASGVDSLNAAMAGTLLLWILGPGAAHGLEPTTTSSPTA